MGMLLVVGGIIGFIFGTLLGGIALSAAGVSLASLSFLGSLLGPVIAPLAVLLGSPSLTTAILTWALAMLVATALAYALAAVDLPPLTAAPGFVEAAARGFIIGLSSSTNFLVWVLLLGSPFIGTILAIINFLAVFPLVSGSRFIYQPILGFASWLFPTTYLVRPLGILLFIINLPSALGTPFGILALRFDGTTGTVETTGGAVVGFLIASGPAPGSGAFNLQNFQFLNLAPAAAPATVQTSFTGPGLSAHETGHTLTTAAFGGFFGWINAIDENIPPLARGAFAYGEQVTDSHFGGLGGPSVPEW
jgi:hypothetical protein